jgi:hypothetical protein
MQRLIERQAFGALESKRRKKLCGLRAIEHQGLEDYSGIGKLQLSFLGFVYYATGNQCLCIAVYGFHFTLHAPGKLSNTDLDLARQHLKNFPAPSANCLK